MIYDSLSQELEKEMETVNKHNQKLKNKCEDQDYQIQTLQEVIETKESDIEQQLIELIHTRVQSDELTLQLQEMWASYSADKALWRNRGGRSIR
jgi:chromosome segregation ATPase